MAVLILTAFALRGASAHSPISIMSYMHAWIKKIAEAKVTAHYDVDPSDPQAADRVKAALHDARYIFPEDSLVSGFRVYVCLLILNCIDSPTSRKGIPASSYYRQYPRNRLQALSKVAE